MCYHSYVDILNLQKNCVVNSPSTVSDKSIRFCLTHRLVLLDFVHGTVFLDTGILFVSNTEICFCVVCASYQWSITTVLDTERCFCVQHRNLFPFSLCLLPMEHYYDIRHENSFLCPTQQSVSVSFFPVAMQLYSFGPHTNGALLRY
jgi:hypothetical protein